MKLADAIHSPEAHMPKVLFAVELIGAMQMKENEPESYWLTKFSWLFTRAADIVPEHGGELVKFLPDGFLAAFHLESAADAINAAIKLQEAVVDERSSIRVACAVGIATGDVYCYNERPDAPPDYIGSNVDLALGYAHAASAKAIWVNKATISAALMPRVQSTVGLALRRPTEEYQHGPQKVEMPGFGSPQEYVEIVWDQEPFGVRSETVTKAVERRSAAARDGERAPGEWARGTLAHWNAVRNIGVIRSQDGVDHFVGDRYLASDQLPASGSRVWFVPQPPRADGQNPLATCVLPVDTTSFGRVEAIIDGKGYGFVEVWDDAGQKKTILWYWGHGPRPDVQVGDEVDFVVSENDRGPTAIQVTPAESRPSAQEV